MGDANVIYGIQILRGLAATLVVFAHIQSHLEHVDGVGLPALAIGGSGVDIFFVISGFIIWTTSQPRSVGTLSFYRRRLIRIVPLYWLVTAFIVSVALAMPAVLSSTVFDRGHVLASFAFIPFPHPVLHDPYPVLVPGWTLNYEMFFYLLFGLALLLPTRLASLSACLAVLASLVAVGFILQPTNYLVYYYTDPIIIEFAFGLCVGALSTHCRRPPAWVAPVAIVVGLSGIAAAGFAGMVDDHHLRFYAVGIPAMLLVFGITAAHRFGWDPKPRLLLALGDASYSIYLTQVIVIPIGVRLWSMLRIEGGWAATILFIGFELALTVAVGWIVHRLVERPMLEWLRSQTLSDRPATKRVTV